MGTLRVTYAVCNICQRLTDDGEHVRVELLLSGGEHGKSATLTRQDWLSLCTTAVERSKDACNCKRGAPPKAEAIDSSD